MPKISFIQIYDTKQQIVQDMNILTTLPIQYLFPNKLFKKRIFCYFCFITYIKHFNLGSLAQLSDSGGGIGVEHGYLMIIMERWMGGNGKGGGEIKKNCEKWL